MTDQIRTDTRRERLHRALTDAVALPAELPISARRDELVQAIADHQVLVVAGETGSGKSTQLPKLCLAAGRGHNGLIGHTQPRRIAARSIAERVATELGTEVGGEVGYTVRFHDEVGEDTFVKVMTDGILLAEIQRDRRLSRYDTLIIDEAHERSLNIDFLLGYLHQLLPRRPDLKVIITSATIDTARFAEHFDAPVIEVSGRAYPVEIRYAPPEDPDTGDAVDQAEAIATAVTSLQREAPGDVLVFCSGEREIRDAAQVLRGLQLPDTEILPLYARLSSAEQQRVFQPHRGRRIVLATNVAETSLTVPGVRYVVDPGTARISRYSHRTKVQRLPIEPVSQASADQRAGRCGRIGPGVCVRLYHEEDLHERARFTEPEVQRTNLASVILKMASLGLGAVEDFGFLDPPDARAIRDGVLLLEELGAVDPDRAGTRRWLTPIGRQLADLPVDPRLGRMILEGAELGCLHEVLVIASALSIQDPRERPTGPDRVTADELHARFAVPGSDLLSYLELWEHLHQARQGRSGNQFRKLCRAEFLHVLRIREWQDLYTQLRRVAAGQGLRRNAEPADADRVHQALLAGLLTHVGTRSADGREYHGVRNSRFAIARDSVLSGSSARWVMAAELVETNRIWARGVARIRPEWVEDAAAHLVKRSYSEAWWDAQKGTALSTERATLHGLVLVADREVTVESVDSDLARRLFIDHALVERDWHTHHRFMARNAELESEIEALGARARRNLLASPAQVAAFFDERLPGHIASARHFDRWWRRRRSRDPHLLDVPREVMLDSAATRIEPHDYPDRWEVGGVALDVSYEFDPTSPTDGVTVEVPLWLLPRLDPTPFEWNVPGYRTELVEALLRTLPKTLRRRLVPIPDTAPAIAERLRADDAQSQMPLAAAVRDEVAAITNERLGTADLDPASVPRYLLPSFRVHGLGGEVLGVGKDLAVLRDQLRAPIRDMLAHPDLDICATGLTGWPGGTIPRRLRVATGDHEMEVFPAIVDEGDSVAVRVLADPREQARETWDGIRRLLMLTLPAAARALGRLPTAEVREAIATSPYPNEQAWLDDLLRAVFDHLIDTGGGPAWSAEAFAALVDHVREGLSDSLRDTWGGATTVLGLHHHIRQRLEHIEGPGFAEAAADLRAHLSRLVYPGLCTAIGVERLPDVVRYLRAIERRLDTLADDPRRDHQRMLACRRLENEYDSLRERVRWSPELEDVGWMLEELRVATFAQQLGTAQPVSEKRILTAFAALGPC